MSTFRDACYTWLLSMGRDRGIICGCVLWCPKRIRIVSEIFLVEFGINTANSRSCRKFELLVANRFWHSSEVLYCMRIFWVVIDFSIERLIKREEILFVGELTLGGCTVLILVWYSSAKQSASKDIPVLTPNLKQLKIMNENWIWITKTKI